MLMNTTKPPQEPDVYEKFIHDWAMHLLNLIEKGVERTSHGEQVEWIAEYIGSPEDNPEIFKCLIHSQYLFECRYGDFQMIMIRMCEAKGDTDKLSEMWSEDPSQFLDPTAIGKSPAVNNPANPDYQGNQDRRNVN